MKKRAFEELLKSVREAGKIMRGELIPPRVTEYSRAEVAAARAGRGAQVRGRVLTAKELAAWKPPRLRIRKSR